MTAMAKEKLVDWKERGHMIILTTTRPEEYRTHTIKELSSKGIPYDRLIMGIEKARYLINDMDPGKPGTELSPLISLEMRA